MLKVASREQATSRSRRILRTKQMREVPKVDSLKNILVLNPP